ncbi:MAG: hypothetical protein GY765_27570 [bacterium]|nr:hypothetical protein [bacterium]
MKLNCPQCGAGNQLETTDTFVTCIYCKNSMVIDLDRITVTYSYAPRIDPTEVEKHLKRDFEKIGFNESIEIRNASPAYIPFWHRQGKDKLITGSALFPEKEIKIPTGEKTFFDSDEARLKNIGIIDIDTSLESGGVKSQVPPPPAGSAKQPPKQTLYYIPFFKVVIVYNQKDFTFYVNAVNGEVAGEPIPYVPPDKAFRLFPLFIGIFLFFLLVNSIVNSVPATAMISLLGMALSYSIAKRTLSEAFENK